MTCYSNKYLWHWQSRFVPILATTAFVAIRIIFVALTIFLLPLQFYSNRSQIKTVVWKFWLGTFITCLALIKENRKVSAITFWERNRITLPKTKITQIRYGASEDWNNYELSKIGALLSVYISYNAVYPDYVSVLDHERRKVGQTEPSRAAILVKNKEDVLIASQSLRSIVVFRHLLMHIRCPRLAPSAPLGLWSVEIFSLGGALGEPWGAMGNDDVAFIRRIARLRGLPWGCNKTLARRFYSKLIRLLDDPWQVDLCDTELDGNDYSLTKIGLENDKLISSKPLDMKMLGLK